MLCPTASEGGPSTVAAATATAAMDHHMMDAAGHEHEHVDHQHAAHGSGMPASSGHHADGFGKCNLCCDFCSMTPLLSTLPTIPTPLNLASVSFPDLFAPAPSFVSDGQERPPRSI